MNVYGTEQIRNVLLGHGAGKTTVAEALAFITGVTKRMGKVPTATPSVIMTKKRSRGSSPFHHPHSSRNMKAKNGALLRSISWILPDFLISWEKQRKLSA